MRQLSFKAGACVDSDHTEQLSRQSQLQSAEHIASADDFEV